MTLPSRVLTELFSQKAGPAEKKERIEEYDDLDWYDGPRCNEPALDEEDPGVHCGGVVTRKEEKP